MVECLPSLCEAWVSSVALGEKKRVKIMTEAYIRDRKIVKLFRCFLVDCEACDLMCPVKIAFIALWVYLSHPCDF